MYIQFIYTNKEGITAERNVRGISANETHLQAFDSKEKIVKTFILNSIQNSEITIQETGEIISAKNLDKYLPLFEPSYPKNRHPDKLQICFTGFAKDRKAYLEELAKNIDMLWVTKQAGENLKILVCGNNAGHKKIEQAIKKNATIWNEGNFLEWIEKQ